MDKVKMLSIPTKDGGAYFSEVSEESGALLHCACPACEKKCKKFYQGKDLFS